jgi:hypothetical protein
VGRSGPEEALRRQLLEPLAEIHQVKGNSECRFDRLARMGIGTDDELCDFEQLAVAHEGPDNMPPPAIAAYPRRSMIRNTLKDGLGFEQRWGVNPWKLSWSAIPTHDAAPGNTGEEAGPARTAPAARLPARLISDEIPITQRPDGRVGGGERVTRSSRALRRRETYATSGTRPVVRFFAGELDGVRCGRPDLIERPTPPARRWVATSARAADGAGRASSSGRRGSGDADRPGTDLQRIRS